MGTTENRRARARLRGQGGFTAIGGLLAVGATATVGGLLFMNGTQQVSAAEQTVCEYNKGIIETAIESTHLTTDGLRYPEATGEDGLDAVREAGFLRSDSTYWKYTGVGPNGQPQLVLRQPVPGCD